MPGAPDDHPVEVRHQGVFPFVSQSDGRSRELQVRASSVVSTRARFSLDGALVGTKVLGPGQPDVLRFPLKRDMGPGFHSLAIDAASPVSFAWAWFRRSETERPATWKGLRLNAADVGGIPRNALTIRYGMSLLCPVVIPKGASLVFDVAVLGQGQGKFSVSEISDAATALITQREMTAPSAAWTTVETPLHSGEGRPTWFQFALQGSGAGRALLGEPRIEAQQPSLSRAPRRTVMLISFGALDIGALEAHPIARRWAESGFTKLAYRRECSDPLCQFSAVFTGRSGPSLRAPMVGQTTLSLFGRARAAGWQAAFMSTVPYSAPALGWGQLVDEVFFEGPESGRTAETPFDRAERVMTGSAPVQARFLAVHARGSHPPWLLRDDELQALPQEEGMTAIPLKGAAQWYREHPDLSRALPPSLRARVATISARSLGHQLDALERLMTVARSKDPNVLIIVTADRLVDWMHDAPLALETRPDLAPLPLWISQKGSTDIVSAEDLFDAVGESIGASPSAPHTQAPRTAASLLKVFDSADGPLCSFNGYGVRGTQLCLPDGLCSRERAVETPFLAHGIERQCRALLVAPSEPLSQNLDPQTRQQFHAWGLPVEPN